MAVEPPQCAVKAEPTALMRGLGILDLSFRENYEAPLLVGNQLVRRGAAEQLRTETSRVRLDGAVVTVLSPRGDPLAEYSTVGTGFVDPGTGTEPGYGAMFATLLPPRVAQAGQVVTVRVSVFGETLGGEEIESNELTYPILVCEGCLVSYPADAQDPASVDRWRCAGEPQGVDQPCLAGQDDPIDCRFCAGASAICEYPDTNPSLR